MQHVSSVIIQERLLPSGTRPVSLLNPVYVAWQALGRVLSSESGFSGGLDGWVSSPPSVHQTEILSPLALREAYETLRSAGCQTRAYAKEALTGSYEAYTRALAQVHADRIEYLVIAALVPRDSGFAGRTLVNAEYLDPGVEALIPDAVALGIAMSPHFPSDTFGHPVQDAGGNTHGELTCIGHSFRKEKQSKLARFVEAAAGHPSITVRATVEPDTGSSEPPQMRARLVAAWGPVEELKAKKLLSMSSAGMHEDLVAFRNRVTQGESSSSPNLGAL